MYAFDQSHFTTIPSHPTPANDGTAARRRARAEDRVARAYRVLARKVRAAATQYVDRADVDDLVHDVFVVAAQQPGKLMQSDSATLSWLIGVAKRCAPAYRVGPVTFAPLDELLVREAGDDVEGQEPHDPWPADRDATGDGDD